LPWGQKVRKHEAAITTWIRNIPEILVVIAKQYKRQSSCTLALRSLLTQTEAGLSLLKGAQVCAAWGSRLASGAEAGSVTNSLFNAHLPCCQKRGKQLAQAHPKYL